MTINGMQMNILKIEMAKTLVELIVRIVMIVLIVTNVLNVRIARNARNALIAMIIRNENIIQKGIKT